MSQQSHLDPNYQKELQKDAVMNDGVKRVLGRIYFKKRVEYQYNYYKKRVRSIENHSRRAFRLEAVFMTLTSFFAAINIQVEAWSVLQLATVILPALAILIGAFRQMYQWDRQTQLYQESLLGLERARITVPPDKSLKSFDEEAIGEVLPNLLNQTEEVLNNEVNQWGQLMASKSKTSSSSGEIIEFPDGKP